MMTDLDKLERIAAHTQEHRPGPWRRWRYGCGEVLPTDANTRIDCIIDSSPKPDGFDEYDGGHWNGETILETDGGFYEPKGITAEYIAALSPDVVLKLLVVAKAAARAADDIRSETPDGGAAQYELCKAVDRLRGEDDNA